MTTQPTPPAGRPEAPPPALTPEQVEEERRLRLVEATISNLLRGGVVLSFLIVTVGVALTFYHHPAYLSDPAATPELLFPREQLTSKVRDVLTGALDFQGRDVVLLGLFLLIATPVLRVAVSIVAFVYQRDKIFIVITSIVLTLLIVSFLLGGAGAG